MDFELQPEQRARLLSGLKRAFQDFEVLHRFVLENCQRSVLDVTGKTAGLLENFDKVLQWAEQDGWIDRFASACALHPNVVLSAVAKSIEADLISRRALYSNNGVEFDPIDACLINRQVFIDRAPLRGALRDWTPRPKAPILAISGGARSGKSYSIELIRYVASQKRDLEVASIDLREESPAGLKPGLVTRRILIQMGRKDDLPLLPKEEDAGSASRWAIELCDLLDATARMSGKTWVIALDGFSHQDLPSETREMVARLVKRAARPGSALRVVLIQYSDDLVPTDVQPRVAREMIAPLSRESLLAYLQRLADQEGAVVEDGVLDDIVNEVVAKARLGDIEAVATEVQRWVDELNAGDATAGCRT